MHNFFCKFAVSKNVISIKGTVFRKGDERGVDSWQIRIRRVRNFVGDCIAKEILYFLQETKLNSFSEFLLAHPTKTRIQKLAANFSPIYPAAPDPGTAIIRGKVPFCWKVNLKSPTKSLSLHPAGNLK